MTLLQWNEGFLKCNGTQCDANVFLVLPFFVSVCFALLLIPKSVAVRFLKNIPPTRRSRAADFCLGPNYSGSRR